MAASHDIREHNWLYKVTLGIFNKSPCGEFVWDCNLYELKVFLYLQTEIVCHKC